MRRKPASRGWSKQARRGEEVVIAKAGEPVVKMVPIEPEPRQRRKFGQNVMKITYLAPDFEEDIPLEGFDVFRDDNELGDEA